jgi:hypothetical protein
VLYFLDISLIMKKAFYRRNGMKEFLENFEWHSSVGIDADLVQTQNRAIGKLPNTIEARALFLMAGENLLIHKATQALWRISDDKKSIVPVFGSDILTDIDLEGEKDESK